VFSDSVKQVHSSPSSYLTELYLFAVNQDCFDRSKHTEKKLQRIRFVQTKGNSTDKNSSTGTASTSC